MFSLARPAKLLEGLGKYFRGRSRTRFVREEPPAPKEQFHVSIIGGTSPTAQSLSLLLTHHPHINRLVLYDVSKATCGLGLDLSHIPSQSYVEGRAGHIGYALRGSNIVVLANGEPRKTGQTDYDLFKTTASSVVQSVQEICKYCPDAFVVDLTEPINYTLPLTSLVLQAGNAYNSNKVLGVTGDDVMRAQSCLKFLCDVPKQIPINIPVICGHSSRTSVPLMSHVTPWFSVDACTTVAVTEHMRSAEDNVVALKRGSGQSTHLAAFAGYNAVAAILNALIGCPEKHIAFVANNDYNTKYFAGPVSITKNGISEIAEYKYVGSIEAAYLQDAVKELENDVKKAEAYYETVVSGKKLYNMDANDESNNKSSFGDKKLYNYE